MKLTYALLRKQRTHNLRYIVRTLLMKLAPGLIKKTSETSDSLQLCPILKWELLLKDGIRSPGLLLKDRIRSY